MLLDMDIHSKTLRGGVIRTVTVCAIVLIFQLSATADYISYGRTLDLPIGIEDEKVWTIAEIFIPSTGILTDIDIAIDIAHPNVCDLEIYIVSPDETTICLNHYDVYDFVASMQDYRMTIFDDDAKINIKDAESGFAGIFSPKDGPELSKFNGQQIFGLWQVRIYDNVYGDTGTLKNIRLDLEFAPTPPAAAGPMTLTVIPEPNSILLTALATMLIRIKHKSWLIYRK